MNKLNSFSITSAIGKRYLLVRGSARSAGTISRVESLTGDEIIFYDHNGEVFRYNAPINGETAGFEDLREGMVFVSLGWRFTIIPHKATGLEAWAAR